MLPLVRVSCDFRFFCDLLAARGVRSSGDDAAQEGRLKGRRLTTRMGAGLAAIGLMGALAACGSASMKATATITAPTTPTTAETPTTVSPVTTVVSAASTGPSTSTSPSTSVAQAFSAIAGWYDGSTGSSGELYIQGDGASRLRIPDQGLCAAPCSDATAPILNEDISLSSLSSTGSGSYITKGKVSGYSSTVPVPRAVRVGVGSTVTLNISATGDLTFGAPGSDPDVLVKGPPPPGFSGSTNSAPPTFVPPPTLGHLVGTIAEGSGFGQVEPGSFSNGGDPTGAVGSIVWSSWGAASATGTGISDYAPGSPSEGTNEPVTVVAFDLGYCEGQYMYQRVDWYFPQHGQSFSSAKAENICTGT